ITTSGGLHQTVHALAELRIALVFREVVGSGAPIARLPCLPTVFRAEDARRRNADPYARLVGWIRHQRMQDQPCASGVPFRASRMFLQAIDMAPRRATVTTGEQAGGLDTGVEGAIALCQAPDGFDWLMPFLIGKSFARMGPAVAQIV